MMREWPYTASSRDVLCCIFPPTSRFPLALEMSFGLCSREIFRASGNLLVIWDVQPNTSLLSAVYGYNTLHHRHRNRCHFTCQRRKICLDTLQVGQSSGFLSPAIFVKRSLGDFEFVTEICIFSGTWVAIMPPPAPKKASKGEEEVAFHKLIP